MRLPSLSFNSLFARVALILLVNVLLVQAVAAGLITIEIEAFDFGLRRLPERIAEIVMKLDRLPDSSCDQTQPERYLESILVTRHRGEMPPEAGFVGQSQRAGRTTGNPRVATNPTLTELPLYLKLHIGDYLPDIGRPIIILPRSFRQRGEPADEPPPRPGLDDEPGAGRGGPRGFQNYSEIGVQLINGCWAEIAVQGPPAAFGWIRTLTRLGGVGIVIILCSLWFARGAARNISQFSAAADAVGRSVDAPMLEEAGPREVRIAAQAFNRMQQRLRRFINDRTQMLAAISHDLRTPLTRLRLRAEFVEDDQQRAKMLADIAEMETMISATLAFARDDAKPVSRQAEDLDQLLDQLASDLCDGGYPVVYEPDAPVIVTCDAAAIRRAVSNLAENAVKYGGVARLALTRSGDMVTITIDDDGPGIAPEMREQVFQPFFRLEGSRNRDTGGVGLGLSVARTIIRGHGGDITLDNRAEGGLSARIVLPA